MIISGYLHILYKKKSALTSRFLSIDFSIIARVYKTTCYSYIIGIILFVRVELNSKYVKAKQTNLKFGLKLNKVV